MKSKEKELPFHNPYWDHYPQSEYQAIFKKGVFTNAETGKPIQLKEGAWVRMVVPNVFILEEDYEQHLKKKNKPAIPKGEVFRFELKMPHEGSYHFKVRSEEEIFASQDGNKIPVLTHTRCTVFEGKDSFGKPLKDFTPFEAKSFNHAYTRVSEKFRFEKSAHTCNVYTTFYHSSGKTLDSIRKEKIPY